MPKSFLQVIFALVLLVIPVFFIVLFLGSARRKKKLRATVLAQLDVLVTRLNQRNQVMLETLRSSPAGTSATEESLRASGESLRELLERFEPTPAALGRLTELDSRIEPEFVPWLEGMSDSYGKRKLVPLQEQTSTARERYNDAARICGQGMFPLLTGTREA
jgi:hypothetical protein